ncbi:hypothetical protein [Winogradskyella sp.]
MLSKAGKKHITDRIEHYEKQRNEKQRSISIEEIDRRIARLKIWLEK